MRARWAAVLFAGALVAAAGAGARRGGPCADDAARLCAHVPSGDGRVAACLRAHEQDLSVACRNALARMRP
jgi:hypothetical protein